MQWNLLAGMTLSSPHYYFPSADFVAFETSVCLLNYHAAHKEREKWPSAELAADHCVRHLPSKGPAGVGEGAGCSGHWGQAGQELHWGWCYDFGMLLSQPAPGIPLCAGSDISRQFRSSGERWRCATCGCRQTIYLLNSWRKTKKKKRKCCPSVWRFWGAAWWAVVRT